MEHDHMSTNPTHRQHLLGKLIQKIPKTAQGPYESTPKF